MHLLDIALIILFLGAQLWLGLRQNKKKDSGTAVDLILGGRMLTLPAFVASLVSTWYGGILGVGEFTYLYGISNWLVFGVPYYVAALLFALFLSKRARQANVVSIPDRLTHFYGSRAGLTGAVIVFFMAIPASYIVMLGALAEQFFGWPYWLGVLAGASLSLVYVVSGGFRALIRADMLQFVLMFAGFLVLVPVAVMTYGGMEYLTVSLPPTHFTWHGGNAPLYIATWYVLALITLTEPAFHQRCYAARSPEVASRGIFISILCWFLFDLLTTTAGLYARAAFPNLAQPVTSLTMLGNALLPPGLFGLFAVAMLATVMSTVDSYAFLSATTLSHDILGRIRGKSTDLRRATGWGVFVTSVFAVGFALVFRSAIDLWHLFGSIVTPALLIPVLSTFFNVRRIPGRLVPFAIMAPALLSVVWYLSKSWGDGSGYALGLEPVMPGLALSVLLHVLLARPGEVV